MDIWLQKRAWHNQVTNLTRTTVLMDVYSGRIVGFVGLSTGAIQRKLMPRKDRHNRPDPIPVILLGQLAVSQQFAGNGIGRSLLFHALKTASVMAEHVDSDGVLTHPLDAEALRFYGKYGFEELVGSAPAAMFLRIKDIKASGF